MKNEKFLFTAIIFLASLLCISAVGAADDAASDIVADTIDDAVLDESIDDADLADSQNDELAQSDENALSDDGGLPPSPPPNTGFGLLNDKIINGGPEINLDSNYSYYHTIDIGFEEGINITRDVTINGNGYTLNGNNKARIFYINPGCTVTFKNIVFIKGNTTESGGAIYGEKADVTAINCTFINNTATFAGAIYISDAVNFIVIDCNFTQNSAKEGGAMDFGTANNCNFINNSATDYGGAVYWTTVNNCNFTQNSAKEGGAIYRSTANYCYFSQNTANEKGGAAYDSYPNFCNFTKNTAGLDLGTGDGGAIYGGTVVNCSFTGNRANHDGGAIYSAIVDNSTFINNSANHDGGAIYSGIAETCTFTNNEAEEGDGGAAKEVCAINCVFNGNRAEGSGGAMSDDTAVNSTFTNNTARNNGGAIYNGNAVYCKFSGNVALSGGTAGEDSGNAMKGGVADSCIFNGDSCVGVDIIQPEMSVPFFTSNYGDGSKLVVDLKTEEGMPLDDANIRIDVYTLSNVLVGTYNVLSGGWVVPLNAGSYIAIYNATDFDIDNVQGMIVINQVKSQITSQPVTTIYNKNKYLVITLKDNKGKPISGEKVTVALAGAKKYTTDKNGQIKINVATLVPKAYVAKIRFTDSINYYASSADIDVIVKKAAAKMTAKKKTFKVKVKTKKYAITLKNNVGKAIKGAKVTIKVNKKTFKAKTNKKGKAVFKIKNLKKKGTYKAVIKFAGDKYYKKVSKKVKIRVKK